MDDWLTRTRNTAALRAWSLGKVPLLHWLSPRVQELSAERVVVVIPLNRRQKNHLGSMYFGVLACGADLAGGLIAVRKIFASGQGVSLIFKDFKADFLKRAEHDTHFTCSDGRKINQLVEKALATGERVQEEVTIVATCPAILGDEPVAVFHLTLSLKKSSSAGSPLWGAIKNHLPFFTSGRQH